MIEVAFEKLIKPEAGERGGRIQTAFDVVRELPFSTENSYDLATNLEQNLQLFIEQKKGSCTTKHYFLGLYYEYLGIKVSYLDYPFYWQNQIISFPKSLREIAEKLPLQHHVVLSIENPLFEGSKMIDATWDTGMEAFGFKVNKVDLLNQNCSLAIVPAQSPTVHKSIYERHLARMERYISQPENEVVKIFYKEFDSWLAQRRVTF